LVEESEYPDAVKTEPTPAAKTSGLVAGAAGFWGVLIALAHQCRKE